jgi:hypothetical protein
MHLVMCIQSSRSAHRERHLGEMLPTMEHRWLAMLSGSEGRPSRPFTEEEDLQMCDYSLHAVASRPARIGDTLVTTSFTNSSTRGFAAVGEPNVAVCLLPGTEVAFSKEAEWHHAFGRLVPSLRFGKTGQKVARFRQVNLSDPHTHHDALEFPDGQIVRVTCLCEAQQVTVLQLPAQASTADAAEEREASSMTT